MVDIYKAIKLQGKYPPLSPTLRIIIDSICHTETKKSFLFFVNTLKNGQKYILMRDFVSLAAER